MDAPTSEAGSAQPDSSFADAETRSLAAEQPARLPSRSKTDGERRVTRTPESIAEEVGDGGAAGVKRLTTTWSTT